MYFMYVISLLGIGTYVYWPKKSRKVLKIVYKTSMRPIEMTTHPINFLPAERIESTGSSATPCRRSIRCPDLTPERRSGIGMKTGSLDEDGGCC
jgi:hypothetical protein